MNTHLREHISKTCAFLREHINKAHAFIREHRKPTVIIAACALTLCVFCAFAAPSIIEMLRPVLSEELAVVSCQTEKAVFEYTGEEITPEISAITFRNKKNEEITKTSEEFKIEAYRDNVDAGSADVEISLSGYQGTLVIKEVFQIVPVQAAGLQVTSTTKEAIALSWNEAHGADSYSLFKSVDGGQNYSLIAEIETTDYQDTDILLNAVYEYYVCVNMISDDLVLSGASSDTAKAYTPLDVPVIASVTGDSYHTLRVEWSAVTGASGYQVYRSASPEGEYTLLTEITDDAATSYSDATCECGRVYDYYIQTVQTTDTETIYGEASAAASGKTRPERVSLSGSTGDGNTKVTLSWKKTSGAHGYEIYRDNSLVTTITNADTLSWSESDLAKDADHSYKVRAYCAIDSDKTYGSFSGTYEKAVTIEYNYDEISAELAVLTQYLGYSYVYGGTSPANGWDCSGFTQYVFKKHFGISLNRTAAEQARQGTAVSKNSRSEWKPGDLLFYTLDNSGIGHVAIYLGNGQMIHALNSKYDTLIQDVDYYEVWDKRTSLYCVRRYF